MLAPKKVKWRKMQKGRRRGTAWRGATLAFGDFGLQALERGWLTAREIEAARVALTRYIKRGGRVRAHRHALPPSPPARHGAAAEPDEGARDQARPGARQDDPPAAGGAVMTTGRRKQRDGVVVSDKMTKTVVVEVERLVRHGRYRKYLKQRMRYKAHDEKRQCRVGDRVRIVETRPLSHDKRWTVRD